MTASVNTMRVVLVGQVLFEYLEVKGACFVLFHPVFLRSQSELSVLADLL